MAVVNKLLQEVGKMKKVLVGLICAAVPLMVAPAAQAHTLSKSKAQSKATTPVRNLCDGLAWCDAWYVEPASDTRRRNAHTVDVEYAFLKGDQVCTDVIRMRYKNSRTRKVSRSYPYEGWDCR